MDEDRNNREEGRRAELTKILYDLGVPPEIYRLDGTHYELAHVLAEENGRWRVFVSERGDESGAMEFSNEREACTFLLGRICLELVERSRLQVMRERPSVGDGDVGDGWPSRYEVVVNPDHESSRYVAATFLGLPKAVEIALTAHVNTSDSAQPNSVIARELGPVDSGPQGTAVPEGSDVLDRREW